MSPVHGNFRMTGKAGSRRGVARLHQQRDRWYATQFHPLNVDRQNTEARFGLVGFSRFPAPRPDLLRWSHRASGLLPRRVHDALTLVDGTQLCGPGGALPVSAGAGEQQGRDGAGAAAVGLQRGARGLGGLHPTVRDCHGPVRAGHLQMRPLAPPPRFLQCCRRKPITPPQPYKRPFSGISSQWPVCSV